MDERADGRMPPAMLLVFAAVAYGALVICALGFLSLATDTDVIAVAGIGPAAGVLAVLASVLAFAAALWPVIRAPRPAYAAVPSVALAAALAHLAALWLFALGAGVATATAAVGSAVTSWTSPVFLATAAAAAWGAIAARRTAARPPRWPWEPDD